MTPRHSRVYLYAARVLASVPVDGPNAQGHESCGHPVERDEQRVPELGVMGVIITM